MSNSEESEAGRREVAYRLFAAEFDDATLSYSESDEERAPNYVVTPTGARVNRLFAVGVLTEVEQVNDDVLRGRVVDPTGAFVTYAGQYQPDPLAFLDRTAPPAFVALTGKARTFEPDDADVVYTSVRPESINAVDDDTRDRWVVTAAEATLERLAVFEAARESDLRGDRLRERLLAAGVRESLAAGIPRALDHYGTGPAYVEAVRQLATDALELVAGERESVRPLDVAPDSTEPAEVGPLPAVELDLSEAAADTPSTAAPTETDTADADAADPKAEAADVGATDPKAEAADAGGTDAPEKVPETDAADADVTQTGAAASDDAATTASDDAATTASDDAATHGDSPTGETVLEGDETPPGATADTASSGPTADASASTDDGDVADDLGDFEETAAADESADDDPGDFDDELAGETDADGAADAGVDEDEMYELDEEERAELEAEFGAEFTSGNEVSAPGEADIDVPGPADAESAAESDENAPAAEETQATGDATQAADSQSGSADDAPASGDESTASDDAPASAEESTASDDTPASADESPPADDVDLEAAAVDTMATLDDGDGAPRGDVVAAVVDEYGVDAADVQDAIESALMSGQCYEPREDSLKAI